MVPKKHRYRRSELRYRYIPISKISRYLQMLLRYLYTISKFCASMSNFVFFDIGVSLSDAAWAAVAPTRYWTQIEVCTLHCESIIARGACAARAALSRCSWGCTWQRGRTGRTGRSTGCSTSFSRRSGARTSRVRLLVRAERRSDQQSTSTMTVAAVGKVPVAAYREPQPWSEQWEQPEFAWRRRLSYARYVQPSTERRSVRFHPAREGWTGAKFGTKIWTRIGRSCLGHLQTKTISTLTKKITFVKY
jgi:hypothetical protein